MLCPTENSFFDGAGGSYVWGRGLFVVSGIWSEEDVDDDQNGVGIDEECQDGDKDYRLAAQNGLDENQHEKVHFSKRSFCPNLYEKTHIWTKTYRLADFYMLFYFHYVEANRSSDEQYWR